MNIQCCANGLGSLIFNTNFVLYLYFMTSVLLGHYWKKKKISKYYFSNTILILQENVSMSLKKVMYYITDHFSGGPLFCFS